MVLVAAPADEKIDVVVFDDECFGTEFAGVAVAAIEERVYQRFALNPGDGFLTADGTRGGSLSEGFSFNGPVFIPLLEVFKNVISELALCFRGWCAAGLPLSGPDGQSTNRVHTYSAQFQVPPEYDAVTD